jgi:hypothetical protein
VGVLRVKWLTQVIAEAPLDTLTNAIGIRNSKSSYLAVAQVLFVGGFFLYCAAIAQLLMAQHTG